MKPRRMSDVARATKGRLQGADAVVTSVVTDSREVRPGALFVALRGEHLDGARFVPEAFERGASGVLVRDAPPTRGPAVVVRSTNDALLDLAADERLSSDVTVVAVTGANGKTSTKDMARAVLSARMRTHASPGSFNNEIGLPMTLLGAPEGTEVIVAEMGARRTGDHRILCEIARPQIVVVTNVGVAHFEIFGSWDRIVEASAEPVEALDEDGIAVLNADDPAVTPFAARCRGKVVTFGTRGAGDVRGEDVALASDGRASFYAAHEGGQARVTLSVPGEHMVANALAAAAVGLTLGVSLEECASALSAATIARWRMETFTTPAGVLVVNDAYNANPESMAAALRAARRMSGAGRLMAVLGTMAELGPISQKEHQRVGEVAAGIGVDRLITIGEAARSIAVAAVREGIGPDDVASYDDPQEALEDILLRARTGDVVLFKASRVVGLERLAEAMR